MTYSINEIYALSLNAGRGAGMEWGLAEDAANAVIWLEQYQLCGATALLQLLEFECESENNPILLGCTLVDIASRLNHGDLLVCPQSPMLILPFLAQFATQHKTMLQAIMGKNKIICDGSKCYISGDWVAKNRSITIEFIDMPLSQVSSPVQRLEIDLATISGLQSFAGCTYAPSTDASRLMGAGAGLNDDD